jgi:hypothetical protein
MFMACKNYVVIILWSAKMLFSFLKDFPDYENPDLTGYRINQIFFPPSQKFHSLLTGHLNENAQRLEGLSQREIVEEQLQVRLG